MRIPLALLAILLAACDPPPIDRVMVDLPCVPGEPGLVAVRATVRDAGTGLPLPDASVLTDSWRGGSTDLAGVACTGWISPGTEGLRAERLGYRTERVVVTFATGRTLHHAFSLRRADPPCCRLKGAWTIRFHLERRGSQGPAPTAETVQGAVVFDPAVPDPMPEQDDLFDPFVEYENGRHAVEFAPFFGGPVAPDVSTTVVGGGESLYQEATGYVAAGDSAHIVFTPRMTHGSISLRGRLQGDSMMGRWEVNASERGASGRFVMRRIPPSERTDALIRAARAEYERELRDGLGEADGWGLLRLRTLDRGQARLVAARYRLISLDSAAISTAASSFEGGAGTLVPLEAGEYAATLIAFSCAGRLLYVDPATRERDAPTRAVRVREGRITSPELAIDSRRIRITASFENREAARCGG